MRRSRFSRLRALGLRSARARAAESAALVEATDDAVIGTTPDGVITSWNRGAALMYGWSRAETIGRPLEMVVPPESRYAVAKSMRELKSGTTAIHHRASGLHRDGHEIDVSLTVCPVFIRGRLAGVSTVARDISDSVKADAERERLLAELADQNDRLRELDALKDEFIALVSHELRTPLTAIHGFLELILDGTAGDVDVEQRAMLETIGRNATRLSRLINDLLFMAAVNAGAFEVELDEVDVTTIAKESIANARPRAAAGGVTLLLDSDPVPLVRADAVRLSQVFDNLLSNAIKFTQPGGRVELTLTGAGDSVSIVVADTGPGLSEDEKERLFTRFFRTAAAAKIEGTGLGLSITKAILDAHHATIEVDSVVGSGTQFRITLPVDVAAVPVAA